MKNVKNSKMKYVFLPLSIIILSYANSYGGFSMEYGSFPWLPVVLKYEKSSESVAQESIPVVEVEEEAAPVEVEVEKVLVRSSESVQDLALTEIGTRDALEVVGNDIVGEKAAPVVEMEVLVGPSESVQDLALTEIGTRDALEVVGNEKAASVEVEIEVLVGPSESVQDSVLTALEVVDNATSLTQINAKDALEVVGNDISITQTLTTGDTLEVVNSVTLTTQAVAGDALEVINDNAPTTQKSKEVGLEIINHTSRTIQVSCITLTLNTSKESIICETPGTVSSGLQPGKILPGTRVVYRFHDTTSKMVSSYRKDSMRLSMSDVNQLNVSLGDEDEEIKIRYRDIWNDPFVLTRTVKWTNVDGVETCQIQLNEAPIPQR